MQMEIDDCVIGRAKRASPTLGCSIEILRDIYIYIMSVGLYVYRISKCVDRITLPKHTHAQSQFFGRLKPTSDTRVIHFNYTLEQL